MNQGKPRQWHTLGPQQHAQTLPAASPPLFFLQEYPRTRLAQLPPPMTVKASPSHSSLPRAAVPSPPWHSPIVPQLRYLMEARCLMATSRAWTDSSGTGICPLTRASCSMRQLTMAIHLIETLNILSLPSPGIVTSKSTWVQEGRDSDHGIPAGMRQGCFLLVFPRQEGGHSAHMGLTALSYPLVPNG